VIGELVQQFLHFGISFANLQTKCALSNGMEDTSILRLQVLIDAMLEAQAL
jgi:hypothetical protein